MFAMVEVDNSDASVELLRYGLVNCKTCSVSQVSLIFRLLSDYFDIIHFSSQLLSNQETKSSIGFVLVIG